MNTSVRNSARTLQNTREQILVDLANLVDLMSEFEHFGLSEVGDLS